MGTEAMTDTEIMEFLEEIHHPCNIPHKVDTETGPNWGEIK